MTIIQKCLQYLHTNRRIQNYQQKFSLSHFFSKLSSSHDLIMKNSLVVMRSIAAQKIRSLNSLESFTTKIAQRNHLVDLINSLMRRVRSSRSKYLLGGGGIILANTQAFDWRQAKISAEESQQYFDHIDECHDIQRKTITCKNCSKRLRIGSEVANISYCQCKDSPSSVYGLMSEDCDWTPFIERKDILVWRREHRTRKGMYEYKMYGSFDDVTADEFLSVQLDMSEFRLTWDKSTAQCLVIDEDAASGKNGIVYYWEVNWPRFFSNRDYCCYRENSEDEETGTILVVSRSVDHPNCPVKKKTWRVQDYHSVLTIRPHTTRDKPGLEFSLTGFENPGLQLPESIITWVAVRGMPEFMMNLRTACIKLREESTASGKEDPASKGEASKVYQENYQSRISQRPMYA